MIAENEEETQYKKPAMEVSKKYLDNVRVDARNSTLQQHLNGSQNDDEESKQKTENNKTGSGMETSSWWRRTTSLPSSLNRRKNILFQKMFKSTTDLKKKRTTPAPETAQSGTSTSLELKQRNPFEESRNPRLKNATTQTIICQQNTSQQNKGYSVYAFKIMELQEKISKQETMISNLKQNHDSNLKFISSQLFELQTNLMKKEKYLSQLIKEREQTILEQQRVIRRLLRKSLTDTNGTNNVNNQSQSTSNNICRVIEDILPDNCFTSDPEDDNEPDPPIEISISVPNLTELGFNLISNITKPDLVERSISENECEKQNIKKLNQIKMERRAKNREKLMAMKRFSGFLKRPEILGKILIELFLSQSAF